MTLRWLLAAAHLLALGIGMGAVHARARALRRIHEPGAPQRALRADAWWGTAAGVWIATGLARLLMETEKPIEYYMHSTAFIVKMALLLGILVLEIRPMVTLIRWRRLAGRNEPLPTESAGSLATMSDIQLALVLAMVLAATAMARGLFP